MNMIKCLTTLIIAISVSTCATKDAAYKAEDFGIRTAEHRKVAILPFNVTIIMQEIPEGMTEAGVEIQERQEGRVYQRKLYNELLEHHVKDKYAVEFQDINATNTLLEHGDGHWDIVGLSDLLGVDAVLSGTLSRNQPVSVGEALASELVTGLISGLLTGGAVTATANQPTNKVDVTVTIHDGADGSLLWSFNDEKSGGVGSSPESLAGQSMTKVARTFPYVQGAL